MKTYYVGPNYRPYYNAGIAIEMQETYNRQEAISFMEEEVLPYQDAKLIRVDFEDDFNDSYRNDAVVPFITVETTVAYYFDNLEILEKTIKHDILIDRG